MSDADENAPIQTATPRSSLGSSSGSSSSSTASVATRATFDAWSNYLTAINGLCSAGRRLSQAISGLEHWGNFNESSPTQASLVNAWDDLERACSNGTSIINTHIISVLQDFICISHDPQENEHQRSRNHNQQIILENAQTMINTQHQFCAASYDAFSSLLCCLICQAPVGFPHEPDCAMLQQKVT